MLPSLPPRSPKLLFLRYTQHLFYLQLNFPVHTVKSYLNHQNQQILNYSKFMIPLKLSILKQKKSFFIAHNWVMGACKVSLHLLSFREKWNFPCIINSLFTFSKSIPMSQLGISSGSVKLLHQQELCLFIYRTSITIGPSSQQVYLLCFCTKWCIHDGNLLIHTVISISSISFGGKALFFICFLFLYHSVYFLCDQ